MAAGAFFGQAGAQQPPPVAAPQQPPQPTYDARTVQQELQALQALLTLREAQLRAAMIDKALLDAYWQREFAGWCGSRPACGLEPVVTCDKEGCKGPSISQDAPPAAPGK